MATLDILHFPDPRLRTRAEEVVTVDDQLRTLVDDMFETMYKAPGIGLAATQVNVHKRVVVIDISQEQDQPLVHKPRYRRKRRRGGDGRGLSVRTGHI
jgi:peptide deformylase